MRPILDPFILRYDVASEALADLQPTVNPADLIALEAALTLRDAHRGLGGEGYEIVAVVPVHPYAKTALGRALCRGCDRGLQMGMGDQPVGRVQAGQALGQLLRETGADLLLTGALRADTGEEIESAMAAAVAGWPLVTRVIGFSPGSQGGFEVTRQLERGGREVCAVPLPAVITISDGAGVPRYVPPMSRPYREGMRRPVEVWSPSGPAEDPAEPEFLGTMLPKPRTKSAPATTGMSMIDKMKLMRGDKGSSKRAVLKPQTPAEAAGAVHERLKEWLTLRRDG